MSQFKKLLKVVNEITITKHGSELMRLRHQSQVARGTPAHHRILGMLGRAKRVHYPGLNPKEVEAIKTAKEADKKPTTTPKKSKKS
jgi:hypothetical protein